MQRLRIRARQLRREATDAERHLWRYLRREHLAGYRFRRQHPIAGYIVDFVCLSAGLVVELDGGQHAYAMAYDEQRTRAIEAKGYRVLRFGNDNALLQTEAVLAEILQALQNPTQQHPSPTLPCKQGREP